MALKKSILNKIILSRSQKILIGNNNNYSNISIVAVPYVQRIFSHGCRIFFLLVRHIVLKKERTTRLISSFYPISRCGLGTSEQLFVLPVRGTDKTQTWSVFDLTASLVATKRLQKERALFCVTTVACVPQRTAVGLNRVNPERYRREKPAARPQIDINLSAHGNRIAPVMAFLRRRETRSRSQLFAEREYRTRGSRGDVALDGIIETHPRIHARKVSRILRGCNLGKKTGLLRLFVSVCQHIAERRREIFSWFFLFIYLFLFSSLQNVVLSCIVASNLVIEAAALIFAQEHTKYRDIPACPRSSRNNFTQSLRLCLKN